MVDEEKAPGYTPLQTERPSVLQAERPLYTASAVELIEAIEAHITVTPMYVPKEANPDRAGIPFLGGNLVPVAFYKGPAMNFCPDESYLPSSAHPEPHELAVEKEIHGYMRNIAGLACKVAAAERMQKWWSRQKGLEARAQQFAEGVRATALFSQLTFAEADLAWAEHARDYRNRAPRSVAQALRVDLEELMDVRKNEWKPVTTEKIDTLLEEYQQQGLHELYEDLDPSEMRGKTFSAPPSKAKVGGIPFSPPFTDASVSTDILQTHSVANAAVRIAEITMLLAPAFAACQNAPTPIPLTPIPQGATEMPVPTNPSTVIPEAPEVATPLPGGPDDEQVIANTLPWPSSISDITEDLPAAGGRYNIVDVDAPNVRKQFDGVKSLLIRSGFTVTSVDNAINLVDKQALLSPVENGKLGDKAQWAIAGITNKGFVIPVDKDGTIMDRPDWATSNVAEYVELTDGYGPEYYRYWEEYNGHWVPVVRDANGRLVAFYDINKGEFVKEVVTPELTASQKIEAMLAAAAPNGLAESRVSTNAGDMTFTFRMDEEGGPWQRLDLPQDQVDAVGLYFFGKLAVLQRNGTHPEDFPEMSGFPYTQYNWDYVNEVQRRVDARFAEGTPYTTGLLSYTQTHLYDYYPEFGGLEPNQPFYGFNVAQVALGEFSAIQQQLVDNQIPHVRANYRPGVSSEGHTETEWEVIVYMMTRDDGKQVLSFVAHSEHDSGMLNPSLRKAYEFQLGRNISEEAIQQAMIRGIYINTISPFLAKTVPSPDLHLLLTEWK